VLGSQHLLVDRQQGGVLVTGPGRIAGSPGVESDVGAGNASSFSPVAIRTSLAALFVAARIVLACKRKNPLADYLQFEPTELSRRRALHVLAWDCC
jgi:hypothetical protein